MRALSGGIDVSCMIDIRAYGNASCRQRCRLNDRRTDIAAHHRSVFKQPGEPPAIWQDSHVHSVVEMIVEE